MTFVAHMQTHPPRDDRKRHRWPDIDQNNVPRGKSQSNIAAFLDRIGAEVFYDEFAARHMIRRDNATGSLDDAAMLKLYFDADALGLRTSRDWFCDCITNIANNDRRNNVREAIDALQWDGRPRLNGWLVAHGSGRDTEFDRTAFTHALVAMVRRVRSPGVKFDQIIVLEGHQGGGKSSFLRILAGGDDYFTDALPIGADGKETIEIAHGKLIVELGELAGIGAKELGSVKAFASRQNDRARLAWHRSVSEVPRQFTVWGTTNDSEYLRDPTGNRRFWPLTVGRIDLDRARADRDQLIAEAAAIEALGEPITLPEHLWAAASEAQSARLLGDTWEDAIRDQLAKFRDDAFKVTTGDVLTFLGILLEKQDRQAQMRVSGIMRRLGFEPRTMGKGRVRGWIRGDAGAAYRIVCDVPRLSFRRSTSE
jgi:predicted P-loop ATPase